MNKYHMLSFNPKPYTIELTNPLIVAFKSSCRRYEIHLEEEKNKKQVTKAEKKAIHIATDTGKLKVKWGQLERVVEMMESELPECIRLAGDKYNMAYLHKDWTKEKKYRNKGQHKISRKGNTRTWRKKENVAAVDCLFS